MTCANVREELDLALGQAELPNEIAEHVHSCVDCTRYWHELDGMAHDWQRADLFKVKEIVLRQVESAIGASLRAQETPRIFNIPYRLQYGIAASTAVVGLALLALLYTDDQRIAISPSIVADEETAISEQLFAVTGLGDLSDDELEVLYTQADTLNDYATEVTAWESFDDLTEDEINYLQNNLTAEDII